MSDELKPCPLCGGHAVWVSTPGVRWPWSEVQLDVMGFTAVCNECGCTIPSMMCPEDVPKVWNRRAK